MAAILRIPGSSQRLPVAVLLSLAWVLLVLAWSLAPALFTHDHPYIGDTALKLVAPDARHWLGTDQLGRDVYSRVVHGAFSSVTSAFVSVSIGVLLGGAIGLLSGFRGRAVDAVVSRGIDVFLAIPGFLLAVVIVSSFGFTTTNVAIGTGVAAIAFFARVMRSEVIKIRSSVFIEASELTGGSQGHILLRHILPNASQSILALAVLQFGASILVIAGLAFLGYGDPPPASDWGLLVANGKEFPSAPWLVYGPAAVIFLTALAISRISRWLKQRA